MNFKAGDVVDFHLNAGLIAASYFVSLAGCCLAVELIHVRTALKGSIRWVELAACSCAMGLVGIWAMHYVGNWSIVMGDGEASLQLLYSPGWTALSAFIPILALFIAFASADRRYKGGATFFFYLLAPGILAGAAVCGMHYAGNYGISNYVPHFRAGYVAGSILIACFACVAALASLFILQDLWMSSFPLRLVVAIVLAATVSAMHWVATMGTFYTVRSGKHYHASARTTNFILAVVVCLTTIPIFVLVRWWQIKRRRHLADRAQQVVLACARFDADGRLLVTQDGHLPSQRITVDCNEMAFDAEFDTSHPAFKWIFRASHNWQSVSRFVPQMRRHLREADFGRSTDKPGLLEDYSVLFREAFCVAASDLAVELRTNLDALGSLYEEVMVTGTSIERMLVERYKWLHKFGIRIQAPSRDASASVGFDLFGKGQLLILASHCSRRDVARQLADGYRLEHLDKVQEQLAKSMQVPQSYLAAHLQHLKVHADSDHLTAPRGALLGFFAIRPGVTRKHWDVVARRDALDELAYVQLSPKVLDAEALAVLQQLYGLTVMQCCQLIDENASEDILDSLFAHSLRQRIGRLYEMVNEPFFRQAVLSSKIVKMPTYDKLLNASSSCQLVVFHIIPDVHGPSLKPSSSIAFTPLSFFQCRQQCLRGAPHHSSFERIVHHELETMFAAQTATTMIPTPRTLSRSNMSPGQLLSRPNSAWWTAKSPKSSIIDVATSKRESSQDCEMGAVTPSSEEPANTPFGGILMSQDVVVETTLKTQRDDSLGFPNYGARSYAGAADTETPTYVDELFVIAVEKWQRADKVLRK